MKKSESIFKSICLGKKEKSTTSLCVSRCVKKKKDINRDNEKSDFLLQENIAFDLENDKFKS